MLLIEYLIQRLLNQACLIEELPAARLHPPAIALRGFVVIQVTLSMKNLNDHDRALAILPYHLESLAALNSRTLRKHLALNPFLKRKLLPISDGVSDLARSYLPPPALTREIIKREEMLQLLCPFVISTACGGKLAHDERRSSSQRNNENTGEDEACANHAQQAK